MRPIEALRGSSCWIVNLCNEKAFDPQDISIQLDENYIRNLNIRQAKVLNPSLLFYWLRETVAIFTYRPTFLKTPALNDWDAFTNSVYSQLVEKWRHIISVHRRF
jgi:hypothetical protein